MSMDTCKICDRNSTLRTCSICQVKGCEICLDSHQRSCRVMQEHPYHMCKVHRDHQLDAYCQQCWELICKNCGTVGHKDHVVLQIITAFDNFRQVTSMSKVGQDLDKKCDQMKRAKEFLEAHHLQKTGISIKPTNQHILELLQEAKTSFDFLKNESNPLTFLSKWSYIQRVLTKFKEQQCTTTESQQSHEQMIPHLSDVSKTFGNPVIKYDARQVTLPPKGENIDDNEKISETFANVVNMNDNPGMPSSTSGLPSGDAMVGDFVNIPIETDTRELNDNSPLDQNQVEKLQKDMQQALVEGKQMEQMIKQCQRGAEEIAQLRCNIEHSEEQIAEMSKQLGQWRTVAEENTKLRCTIEHYKKQMAEMSKQLGLFQQEKDYILSMATSMVPWIADINERKDIVNSYKLDRPEGISVGSFVDNMELIMDCVTAMKKEMLTTEGNLAANIAYVAKWTDEQRQTEDGLNTKIQDQAKTIHAQDNELKIRLSRIQEIQEINSAYQGIKNENNKLRQFLFDNEKKADQQQRNQSHVNDELKRRLHNMNTDLQQRAARIELLQRAMQDLQYQIDQKDDKIKDFKREAEDLRTRLSSLDGDKLTKGNPAITDLGDPNRPMKLAEKYGELYDNEWTDALDSTVEMKALYPDMKAAKIEEVIIRHLYQLVMCCCRECLVLSKEQMEKVGNMIVDALKLNTEEHDGDIPGCKEVSTFRRQTAAKYADYLFKHKVFVDKIVLSDWEYVHKSKELVGLLMETPFFEKCVNLCWHMAIQDPVMHLDEELTPDAAYDKNVYREFVKSGDKVTFVVWPALFLHEGGPLLNKGVVQVYH